MHFPTLLLRVASVVTIHHLMEASRSKIGWKVRRWLGTIHQVSLCTYLGVEFWYEVILFIITWSFEFEVVLLQQFIILCLLRLRLGPLTFCFHKAKKLKSFARIRLMRAHLLYSFRVWRYTVSTALPSSFQPCFEFWWIFPNKAHQHRRLGQILAQPHAHTKRCHSLPPPTIATERISTVVILSSLLSLYLCLPLSGSQALVMNWPPPEAMKPKSEEPVRLSSQLWSLLEESQEHWLGSFLLNLLGYALIIVPAGLLIRRWKKDPQIKRGKLILCAQKMLWFGMITTQLSSRTSHVSKNLSGVKIFNLLSWLIGDNKKLFIIIFAGQGPVNYLLKLLVFGNEEQDTLLQIEEGVTVDPSAKQDSRKETSAESATAELSAAQYCLRLVFCIVGLQGAYLTWGVLQVSLWPV